MNGSISGWSDSIKPKGRVAYTLPHSERRPVSGIHFYKISEQDQRSLQDYLATLNDCSTTHDITAVKEDGISGLDGNKTGDQ
jgi:hypothetical protein